MFGKLFGKKMTDAERDAAEEAFAKAKETALERVLGPMDDMVYHALIPFAIGGTLDLYTYSKAGPGVVFATQELIGREKSERPKKNSMGYYELAAVLPPGRTRDDEKGVQLVNSILNPIGRYAFMARLNPGETAEIPTDDEGGTQGLIFGELDADGKAFEIEIGGKRERFGLLLVVPLHASELEYARKNGGAALVAKMKEREAWPYADLERAAVV